MLETNYNIWDVTNLADIYNESQGMRLGNSLSNIIDNN